MTDNPVVAFLCAGLDQLPRSILVQRLADARREIARLRTNPDAFNDWFNAETRQRGVRENAAVLAMLELPDQRERVATQYRQAHPDRTGALAAILIHISPNRQPE